VEPSRWHARGPADVLAALDSTNLGLPAAEAAQRLTRYGPNRLPTPSGVSPLRILLDQFHSVVVLLLVAACVVSLVLGDAVEAAAIAAVLAINTGIGFATELRARRAIAAILQLDTPQAVVLRDGILRVIASHEVVPGDIIELKSGSQVAADARLVESTDVHANEAVLTGESLPSSKHAELTLAADAPLADRGNMVYAGTTITSGLGRAVVVATGGSTEVGRIGELTSSIEFERTPLERRLDALGRVLVWLALGVAAMVAGLAALQGSPLDIIIETGIALAVAAVPEALPAVATIALAVGLHRMAARNALVRRLPAVESLGSTTVVCTDKTRTLTSGDMAVRRTWAVSHESTLTSTERDQVTSATRAVICHALIASRVPAETDAPGAGVDPVDRAVFSAAARLGLNHSRATGGAPQVGLVPFSSERKFLAVFLQSQGEVTAYVKGAPGRVLDLCSLDAATRTTVRRVNDALAADGLRVLGVASGRVAEPVESSLSGLTFDGFIGLADPPAAGVKETIALLQAAGLRTIMLTGDQRLTAQAVGRELGLLQGDVHVVEGRELESLSKEDLRAVAAHAAVFSRITPEHKLRIVEALQARGEIVAMLGDGVNDAPALRKADVGVAMGTRGTDAAKQAAAIVLRDDRFETISAAVEEGRVVFDNIRKFVLYLFSCNVAEVFVLLVAGVAGLPLPLWPLQLLWLNMITDTFPALALAMEPAESNVMTRPPRRPDEAILSRPFLLQILMYGSLITAATMGAFLWALAYRPMQVTTIAFMTLALAQILHLGNARRRRPVLSAGRAASNPYAVGAVLLSAGLQVSALYIDPLPRLLRVSPLDVREWAVVGCCALIPAVVGQALKLWRSRL
jgi:Ca2+-transporting ATPase